MLLMAFMLGTAGVLVALFVSLYFCYRPPAVEEAADADPLSRASGVIPCDAPEHHPRAGVSLTGAGCLLVLARLLRSLHQRNARSIRLLGDRSTRCNDTRAARPSAFATGGECGVGVPRFTAAAAVAHMTGGYRRSRMR